MTVSKRKLHQLLSASRDGTVVTTCAKEGVAKKRIGDGGVIVLCHLKGSPTEFEATTHHGLVTCQNCLDDK